MLLNARRVYTLEGSSRLILLAFQDVTEHRRAEAELRQSGERFRFLAESMPQIIFTAKPNGDLDYFNRHWTEFTGLSSESIENLNWTRFVHPADLEENRPSVAALHRHRRTVPARAPLPTLRRGLPMAPQPRQRPARRRRQRADLDRLEHRHRRPEVLRRRTQGRPTTARTNSWRCSPTNCETPWPRWTAGCRCFPATIDESDRGWALTMAEHQVRLLTRMVDDLLDTSRITRGTFQLRKERVRPAELIDRAVDTVRHLAEAQGHHLARHSGPGPAATARPTRLGWSRSSATS